MVLKIKEIREMSKDDLEKRLAELRMELMKLYTQVARGTTLKSPGQVKQIKKTIARIKFTLKTKEGTKKG